jgi:hypothetical protein
MKWLQVNWGNVIAIIALLAAVPLSIVGNLVTPLIKNWYAERSLNLLKKRIQSLKNEKVRLEKEPPITEGTEIVLSTLMFGALVIYFWGGAAVSFASGWMQSVNLHTGGPPKPYFILGTGLAIIIASAMTTFVLPIQWFLRKRGLSGRRRRDRTIEELEKKLNSQSNDRTAG